MQTFDASDISTAYVDREEITDGTGRGSGRFSYTVLLRMADGTIQSIMSPRAFNRENAEKIVASIARIINPRGMRTRPTRIIASSQPGNFEQSRTEERDRVDAKWAYVIGCIVIAGSLPILAKMQVGDRINADIIGSTPMCQYSWRLSGGRYETIDADCATVPQPYQAPLSEKPKVDKGQKIDVEAMVGGDPLRASWFVQEARAREYLSAGRMPMMYNSSLRRLQPYPSNQIMLMMLTLPFLGICFFFVRPIRRWLRRRGLAFR